MSNEAKTSRSVDPKYWFNLAVEQFIIEGKSKRSAETYAREIKMITKYYKRPLNSLSEDEIRKFVVYRRMKCNLSASSMKILHCGLKFLYRNILNIEYPLFEQMKVQSEYRLPDVLTRKEVINLLNNLSTFHSYVFFRTLYSCGLRLSEGLNLRIQDIDGERGMLKINGKGSKDRYVPLPSATYELLKLYWKTHKNKKLIFPALGRNCKQAPVSQKPMAISSVEKSLKEAARAANIKPDKVRPHVLRHSYATHLIEHEVSIRAVQKYLGHANLEQTMVYFHLTQIKERDGVKIINSMMGQVPLLIPFNNEDIALPIPKQAAIRCRRLGRPPKKQSKSKGDSKRKGGE